MAGYNLSCRWSVILPTCEENVLTTSSNTRISICAGFSLGHDIGQGAISKAKRIIGFKCSKQFGGCSIIQGMGFWSHQGDDLKNQYDNLNEETLLWVNLMIMPDQIETARECLRECGETLKQLRLAPDIRRIHCEVTRSVANHITVDIPMPVAEDTGSANCSS